jgi:hypothetical protein
MTLPGRDPAGDRIGLVDIVRSGCDGGRAMAAQSSVWTRRRALVVGAGAALMALVVSVYVGMGGFVVVVQTHTCPVGDPPPPCAPQPPPVLYGGFDDALALFGFGAVFAAVVIVTSMALWLRREVDRD